MSANIDFLAIFIMTQGIMAFAIETIIHKALGLGRTARALLGRLLRRHRIRRLLRELDARRLADLRISDRDAEAAKWFWEK